MAQVINFAKNIKDLLYDNWSLTDELDRKKFYWSGSMIPPKIRAEKPLTIEVTNPTGDGFPQSSFHTKIHDLFKIDLWMKLIDPTALAYFEKRDTDRALVKNEIMKIIHDNQNAITGLKIGVFGRFLTQDEMEKAPFWFHNTVYVRGEWFHKKSS